MTKRWAFAPLCLLAIACGGSDDEKSGSDTLDVRVAIPAEDPSYVDFVTPEVVIEPGTEKMLCYHVTYDGPDVAITNLDAMQGKYGHHAVILEAKEPQPTGTLEDCTSAQDMSKYRPLAIPGALPDGQGIFLPTGTSIVIQMHYVNSSSKQILVRDVVRNRIAAPETIEKWAAMFITSDIGIKLPPASPFTHTFDCTLESDVELLFIGGHMHENGSRFELEMGPSADALESLYVVDPWVPEFRDLPPITRYNDAPLPLPAGTVIRTTCEWKNDNAHELVFPEEMCVGFGYISGTQTAFVCEKSGVY